MDDHDTYAEWRRAQKRILRAAQKGRGIRLSPKEVQNAALDISTWECNTEEASNDRA